MNKQEIKDLLNKYFEAETSLEEEKSLRQYFSGPSVDPAFEQVAPLFRSFVSDAQIGVEKDFTAKFDLSGGNHKQTVSGGGARIFTLRKFTQIAAAVCVLTISSILVVKHMLPNGLNKNNPGQTAGNYIEVQDPEQAIEYTEDAIRIFAKVFKTSEQHLESTMERIDKTPVIGTQN